MEERDGLPLPVWVLIGFLISFVGIGGGVLIGRAALDDDEGATATTVLAATTSTLPPTSTSTAPPTTAAPAPTTTSAPADTGGLTSGLPDGFEWPHDAHPPFPFPAPAEVRGRIEEDHHCGEEGEEDGEEPDGSVCLLSYTFSVDVDDEDVTVDQVLAHLESAAPEAGWSRTEDAAADLTFTHSCGGGCHALVQLDVREPERNNRGPRLEVVVTFDDH